MGYRSTYYRMAANSLNGSARFVERQITDVDADILAIISTYDTGNVSGDANDLYLSKAALVINELQKHQDLMHGSITQIRSCAKKAMDKAEYWARVEESERSRSSSEQ